MDIFKELKTLVQSNKLKIAIDKTSTLLNDIGDSDYLNTITLLSSQVSSLENQELMMTIRPDDATRRRNQISLNFLNLLDQMKDRGLLLKTETKVSQTATFIETVEQDGLQKQAELLVKKLNFFREKMAIESDPSKQFTLSTEIEKAEAELSDIKEKIRKLASK